MNFHLLDENIRHKKQTTCRGQCPQGTGACPGESGRLLFPRDGLRKWGNGTERHSGQRDQHKQRCHRPAKKTSC